jgi:chromosome segregation ATPase
MKSLDINETVMTVNEYADHFSLPIDTVRSRIRLGKLTTQKVVRSGRELTGIVVDSQLTVNRSNATVTGSSKPGSETVDDSPERSVHAILQTVIDDLRQENQQLHQELKAQSEVLDKWRTSSYEAQTKIAELTARLEKLDVVQETVMAQRQAIEAQRIANDALNNERLVITRQLQKYNSQTGNNSQTDSPLQHWWQFWNKGTIKSS